MTTNTNPSFTRENGELFLDKVSLKSIAQHYGTPVYVYSLQTIIDNYKQWALAASGTQKIYYAVKANSNIAILNKLAEQGSGFDIVSIGEFKRVIAAGGCADKIIFSGVGKTQDDIQEMLEAGIHCFNVESSSELKMIGEIAQALGKSAPISIRVNPNIDAMTHAYISTGLKHNKFGVSTDQALALYRFANQHPFLSPIGIDSHIGSQILSTQPLIDSLQCLLQLIKELNSEGIELEHIDLGGGIGVAYDDTEQPPSIDEYVSDIQQLMAGRSEQLIFEPGRSIVAKAGVLLTQVLHLKIANEHNFAIVDAAMNDYLRPALYSSWNKIETLELESGEPKNWDIVGPICESADFLGNDRHLTINQHSLLCVFDVGAYGFSMSSNYNSRCRATEILIANEKHYCIRQRETFDAIISGEKLLPRGL